MSKLVILFFIANTAFATDIFSPIREAANKQSLLEQVKEAAIIMSKKDEKNFQEVYKKHLSRIAQKIQDNPDKTEDSCELDIIRDMFSDKESLLKNIDSVTKPEVREIAHLMRLLSERKIGVSEESWQKYRPELRVWLHRFLGELE